MSWWVKALLTTVMVTVASIFVGAGISTARHDSHQQARESGQAIGRVLPIVWVVIWVGFFIQHDRRQQAERRARHEEGQRSLPREPARPPQPCRRCGNLVAATAARCPNCDATQERG
jgi:rubrerythrin